MRARSYSRLLFGNNVVLVPTVGMIHITIPVTVAVTIVFLENAQVSQGRMCSAARLPTATAPGALELGSVADSEFTGARVHMAVSLD